MKRLIPILFMIVCLGVSMQSKAQSCSDVPVINSFEPNTGFIGSLVTVYGANFDASTIENNVVYFGATQAEVVSATFGTLEVIVPVGASTAPISVTNACELTAYSKVAFNGVFCPTPLDAQSYDNRAFDLTGVYGAYNMISQDMDLDGRPEVISSRNDGGVTIAKNNSTPGNLSFTAINDATGGGQSVYAADFDGDGYKDLLYTYNVQRNTSTGPGDISLAPIISNNSISNYQVAAGDFNNDGKIDIIGAVGNDVYLALNTSTGPGVISFAPRQFIANVGATPTGLQIADIDGDGKVDYIASQRFGNRAVSMRNTTATGSTTTSWEAPEYWASDSDATDGLGTEPYRSQLADFDKDGKIDFTSCNYAGTTNTAIWRNISTVGNIEFAPTVNLPAPQNNYRIGVGDVDGDGYPDIVTKSLGLNVFSVYRNTSTAPGEPTFAPRIDYTSSWQAEVSGIVIGDLDGDFVPDIATSGINSNRILFHRNTSSQEDASPPTAIAQDIVVGLDPSGNVTVAASQVDNGSSDACGIGSIVLSQTAFTCADIGENSVTLTVTDIAGNVSTADAVVNVQPAAIIVSGQTTVCQGETIPMTANDGDAYQWYKDGEIIAGATSQVYNASETGAYTVDVTNAGGCSGTSLATDITIQGSSSVEVTVSNETYCPGSTTLTASQSALYQWALDGVDIPDATLQTLIAVGSGVYSVRVVDLFGCSASGTATVLADTQAPVATLNGAAVMNLIQGDVFVDEGVSVVDNCETTVLVTGVVDVNNVGVYTISYVAEDGSGNTSNTLVREVTVLPASISIQANGETEFCPGGTVELSFNDLTTNTLLDNATVAPQLALGFRKLIGTYNGPAVRLRRSSDNQEQDFGFSGVDLDINAIETFLNGSAGYATILYDQSGNNNHMTQASQSIQPLFVKDGFNGKPMLNTFGTKRMMNTINLVAEFTVVYGARQVGPRRGRMLSGVYNNWLLGWWNGYKSQYYSQGWVAGPYGTGSNNNAYVYSGTGKQSTDTYAAYENGVLLASNTGGSQGPSGLHIGAGGTNGYEPSDGYFTDLVAYNRVLSTDDRELVESIIGSYNGIYGEAPQTVAAYEPTLQWSRDGSAIDGANGNTFVTSESGNYLVEANINGNVIASNSIEVISEDLEAPVLTLTGADQTIELGDSYAEQGATVIDNCDTPEVVIGGDNVNTGVVGTYLVTYDAADASGNQAIQLIRTVTVQDLTRPVAIAKDVVVELDENGNATITANQVNNGSTDASGDLTFSLDQTTFDCDDVGAEQAAEYGVLLDGKNDFINMGSFNGALNNTSEATYQIWVNMLSLSGAYNSIVEAQHTSGTGYLSLEYDNVNRKLGVWVTGGNVLTQNSVIDLNQWVNITAVFNGNLPQQDRVKIYIDGVDQPMANSTITSSTATDIGDLIIGSQFGTTQFSNIIYDEVRIWGKALSPQEVADNWNQTIVGDEAGLLGYYSFEDGPGSSTVTELTGNQGQAMLNNMDPNTAWVEGANGLSQGATGVQVTLTVTDGSNNSSTATALVTVEDNIHPVLVGIPADVTVECDAVPDVAVVTATDNCSTPLVTFSEERVDGISNNNYTLIRTWTTVDGSGNTASGTQIITVEDNIAPTLVGVPADVTVEYNAVPDIANVTAIDNCTTNPPVSFIEERIDGISNANYTLTRTWSTVDESGNTALATQVVTVVDATPPTVITKDITVQLDDNGNASITPEQINNGSTDNSGGSLILELNQTDFNCDDLFTNDQALAFDGLDDQVTIPNDPAFDFTTGTIETWVRPGAGSTNQAIASMRFKVTKTRFSIHLNQSAGTLGIWNGSGFETISHPFQAGTWYHVSVVFTPGYADLYVNGTLQGRINVTLNDGLEGAPFVLGSTNDRAYEHERFNGELDDVRVWNDVRTDQEILTDMNTPLSGGEANLVAYYTMADGTGSSILTDQSQNGFSGDLVGMDPATAWVDGIGGQTPGPVSVTLTVTDETGNSANGIAHVTVEDSIDPEITLNGDATVFHDAYTEYTDLGAIASDNCVVELTTDSSVDTDTPGAYTVTYIATDGSENQATATRTVIVRDITAPQVVVQPASTSLDASGNASITIDDVVASTTDDSGTVNVSVSDSDFACVDLGDNTVSITGEDLNGNSLGLTTDGLIGYWKFGGANPLVDLTGNWGDIELMHGATINNGALDVNPGNFARTTGYHGTENITSKTLISYVSIQNLNVRSGSAMSIDGVSNDNFDAIVYAERQVFRWMNGSSNFRRTQDLNPGFAETEANQRVQMAITYEVVNGQVNITVYRNGIQIGAYSDPDDTFWTPNNVEILFGTRHSSGNNPIGGLDARVEKALIYNRALSAQEIAAMNGTPVPVAVVDEIAPTIPTVADISVFATSAAGAVVNYDTPVGVDNCSATTLLTEGLASGETFPIGITTVSYTVTDLSGNSAVTTFNVDVAGIAPEIIVPEAITVSNDAGVCGAIVSYAATETVGIPASVITYDIVPGSSFAVGTATVTATATNAVGVSSKTFTVTVEDTEAPNAIARDFSVDLDANGVAEITIADINAGSDDNCGIAEIRLDKTSFDCSNVGTNTVTLTVIDIHDNISEVTATVTVSDVTAPVIEVTPVSVNLDENGNYSLDPGNLLEDRVSALVRQREIARTERRLALYQRRLLHLERRVAAYEARLASLNEELTQATTDEDRAGIQEMIDSVTTSLSEARDAVNESMLTMEEVQQTLDALLNVPVLGTVDDACGIESIVASQLDFDCNHIGDNTIVLTVTDVNANVSTAEVVVTVSDVTLPNVLVQSIQVSLDASGQAVITPADIDAGSNDACGIKSLSLDITSFDCSDIGANTVTLTVTDNNENVSVAQATVTISDITPAEVLTQDFRVELDANGTAVIAVGDIDAGSNDACGIDTMELDKTTFDCTNVGPNTVTLTVTDVNGNVSDATAIVTVVDVIAPTVTTKNITVALDENGEYTITPQDVNDSSFDNCTFSLSLDNNSFDCNTLGENTVMLTATDASNNSTTVAATVTVIDNAAPTIVANNIEVQLDENGETSITVSDVDGGTYDNCAVATVTIDVNSFNCDNLGENTVTITATDVNGNTSTGPAIVTVVDVIAPTVGTRNISVELDDNGNVNITPEEVLILSEDDLETGEDCTVSAAQYHAMWLSKYVKEKGYGKNKGSYKGKGKKKGHYYSKYKDTRFVFDANGGSISRNLDGTATVTGTLVSTQDPDDQWTVSLNLENARNWSEWSALGRSYKDEKRLAGKRYLDWTYYEMAADSKLIGAGNNTGEEVALTHAPTDYRYGFQLGDAANSKNGNFGMSGWFFYTNRDGKQVQGDFNLDVADCADQPLPAGSVITSDNCSIVSYELDITSFDCTNLGENTVQVTVTDQSGNATTESATVTVSDNIAPVAVATNITVSLGEDGTVVVDASELDGGSTDNTDCPLTFTLSQNTFDCNDIGKGSYYQDDHSCDDDRHRHKKGKGHYSYKGKGYGHRKGSRKKGHRVTLTVTDAAGNSSTANAYITVVDDLAPVISADPVTIVVYDRRKEYLKKYDVEPRVTDNCEVYKVYFPRTRFDRTDVGMNTVMVTATDKSGNTVTGPLNVNVIDISSYGKRVTMCYRGRTYRVSKYKVQYYLRKGASLGTCSTDITMAVGGSDLNQTIGEREVDWEPLIELGAYPNPTRGMTTITFSSEEAGPAQMAVVNAAGVPMTTLYDGNIEAEENVKVTYNTSELPNGMYIIRLVTAGKVKNLKLMVKK